MLKFSLLSRRCGIGLPSATFHYAQDKLLVQIDPNKKASHCCKAFCFSLLLLGSNQGPSD